MLDSRRSSGLARAIVDARLADLRGEIVMLVEEDLQGSAHTWSRRECPIPQFRQMSLARYE